MALHRGAAARHAAGGYRYRNGLKAEDGAGDSNGISKERRKLVQSIIANRQLLSQASSEIRELTASRNELIAQALQDGLTVARIAALIGENARAIRAIGLSRDVHPSERNLLARDVHWDALRAKNRDLTTAERRRTLIIQQREALIITAHRTRTCDDLELATLTGLTADHIRRATRRAGRLAERASSRL